MSKKKKSTGFTLIEILIALSIVSIALIGLVKMQTQSIKNLNYFKQKTVANLIDTNLAIENRILKKTNIGISDGTVELAKKTWYWQTNTKSKTINTAHNKIIALITEVSIYADKTKFDNKQALSTLEIIAQIIFLAKDDEI